MNKIKPIKDPEIICDYTNVYAPSDDTFLILDYLKRNISNELFDGLNIENIKRVLDMGTGTGVIALLLHSLSKKYSNFNPEIYASDILEESIICAKFNQELNKIPDEITFLKSDLFNFFPNSLKFSFDIIIFNPPYLPTSKEIEIKTNIEHCWDGGEEGYELILKFLDTVNEFLNPANTCYIYIISSSSVNIKELQKLVEQRSFQIEILKKKHVFFEDIILFRLKTL